MPPPRESGHPLVGWDVGGAHLKACLVVDGVAHDIAQWPCPLWQGLDRLDAAIAQARARWPLASAPEARHVATMTGEMVDLFADREQGVARLAAHLAEALGPSLRLYAGPDRWVAPHESGRCWQSIASANWQATARLVAERMGDGLLVDIGSTTTDLIALQRGRAHARGTNDTERLASGELVYQGVVRTPLCALGPRVPFAGQAVNVMNEFFATTADVYRLTGELNPAHDQQATADGQPKDIASTQQRLARMVGRDARDASPEQWLALAHCWREAQLHEIAGQARRVADAAALDDAAPVIAAGCGAFLAEAVAERLDRPCLRFARCIGAPSDDGPPPWAGWADVCAPAVSVALQAAGG